MPHRLGMVLRSEQALSRRDRRLLLLFAGCSAFVVVVATLKSMQPARFSQILDLLLMMRVILISTVGHYLLAIFSCGWLRSKPFSS